MRYKHLDLNLLVALDALLIEKNVSQAAKRLHLSQSATSSALARLREYFEDELLIQMGRRMVLTPRAEDLVQPVHEVLMQVDNGIARQPVFDPYKSTRSFSLLVSDLTTTVLMPQLLQTLFERAPHLQINMYMQSQTAQSLLEDGDADFLIIPFQFVSPAHPCVPIFEDEYVVVSWRDHPGLKDELTLQDYLRASHVAASFGTAGAENQLVLESWFLERQGITRHIEVSAPSMVALPYLVVGTERLATVHKRIAKQAAEYLPIKIWPTPMPTPKLSQMLQWNKFRNNDAGLMWLRDVCVEVAGKI